MAVQYSSPIYKNNKIVGWDTGSYSIPVTSTTNPYKTSASSGSVLGTSSSGGGGGGNQSIRQQMESGQIPWNDNLLNSGNNSDSGIDEFNAMIDRDYDSAMGMISQQESGLRSQADTATAGATADYGNVKTAIGAEQATKEAGIAKEEQTATTNQKSALQQARDLFRETQQANNAQMSGLGISSSSVTEALAEKLGVETARRIAGVTGSTQEIMQNLAAEKTRVQTYFKEKLTNLENQLAVAKRTIQDSLMAGLQQLNQARTLAASDKANRRAELMRNAQAAQAQAQLEAQKFQQALQMWNEQKNSSLAQAQQFVVNPTDWSGLTKATNAISSIQNVGLTQYPPALQEAMNQYYGGQITIPTSKKKTTSSEVEGDYNGDGIPDTLF